MASSFIFSGVALLVAFGFLQYRSLQKNIHLAKQSGFNYVISPVYFQSIPWIILQPLLIPFLLWLPSSWTKSWLPLHIWGKIWHAGYEPFEAFGEDNIMVVSATSNILWTCDPQVITQVLNRRYDFIKPVEMLGMLNIYGPTITASEGEEHQIYRKVASPSFNDKNYQLVWTGATEQVDMMVQEWNQHDGIISNLNTDSAKLALHVISKVFFGRSIGWRNDDGPKPDSGHTLTYGHALSAVFEYNSTIFLTPRPMLNHSPMKSHKLAKEAFVEWGKYMEEMRDSTVQHLHQHQLSEGGTLIENFVKAGTTELNDTKSASISSDAILGNIFIFILAGHETSANTLTNAITLLACRPEFQKSLQLEIDAILGDRKFFEFNMDFTRLMKGRVGALMKETVRLYSVLPFLPKINKDQVQTLKVGDQMHVLPANTLILINSSAAHRNPKHWPKNSKTAADGPPYPVSDFYPERWLKSPETSDTYNPPEGAYIPFGDGFRSCLGQRFAQAEFCAAIVRLFSEYSVVLDNKHGESFETSLRKAEQQLSNGMGFEMGLKMEKPVPLKLVKRAI